MAQTRFTGPVVSDNGFVGSITLTDIVGDTLTISGATALNGGLTMDTNKFVVANTSGNTTIGGTLGVTGLITATGGVSGVIGATGPAAATVTTLTASGATTFSNATVKMTALPTSDPTVAGALWIDGTTLKVSAG